MSTADAEGHVLGNFHAYYSFNPVAERLRFMDANTSNAVRHALLALGDAKPSAEGSDNADARAVSNSNSATVLDIGCNEGDLTIGLYDALSQSTATRAGSSATATTSSATAVPLAGTSDDVAMFDANSTSVLNERMQKEKKRVTFVVRDVGGSSHRKRFACDVLVDGTCVGSAEGVSKKVAKAKAADAALQTLQQSDGHCNDASATATSTDSNDNQKLQQSDGHGNDASATAASTDSNDSQTVSSSPLQSTLTARKQLFVLGVDIDDVLIARAAAKAKAATLAAGDNVQFSVADVSDRSFDAAVRSFLALAKRPSLRLESQQPQPTQQRPFDLVTCFSVTMWIHLNKGDDGLWTFLDRVSSMASHLILEPQPWKCYRNALKRLSRMRVDVPTSFREIQVRNDVVERIDAFLLDAGRFRYKAQLGKTNWSRPVLLYSRTRIPGLDYVDAPVSAGVTGAACQ